MRLSRVGDVRERFFQRFEINEQAGCWNWTGTQDNHGYGVISGLIDGVRYGNVGQNMLAHRVSWILHFGPIPDVEGADFRGTVIRHKCDNRLCVNPDHLEIGTQYDNVNDAISRDRFRTQPLTGEKHGNAKLTTEQAMVIAASTETNKVLAEKYGVSKCTIKRIRCGIAQYLDKESRVELYKAAKTRKGLSRPGVKNPFAKLTVDQVRYIRSSPLTSYQLADELGVSQPTVASVRRRATYKDVI